MKELFFGRSVNNYGETVYRLSLEIKEKHYLVIETCEDNYKCDMYFSDRNKTKGTIFYFAPCQWGNHHYVLFKRKYKAHFNSKGELISSEYPIVETPEKIRNIMLKWAKQYVNKMYER